MDDRALIMRLRGQAAENLIATYLGIGAAAPQARIERTPDVAICVCELPHAVGNFAIVERLDEDGARRIREIAERRPGFNVYVLADAEPGAGSLLARQGFEVNYRLEQLLHLDPPQCERSVLRRAETVEERAAAAKLMTEQFFPRLRGSVRSQIAQATADCGFDLYVVLQNAGPIGATMICRTQGMLGIYNLCVKVNHRGSGWGGAILQSLLGEAAAEGRKAVLQCDGDLVPWYLRFGFRPAGKVEIFQLGRR
jgi:GNAT superfamily N-acetyltransferase